MIHASGLHDVKTLQWQLASGLPVYLSQIQTTRRKHIGTFTWLLPSRQRSDQRKASSSLCVLVEQRLFGHSCLGSSKFACGSSLGSLCIAPVVPDSFMNMYMTLSCSHKHVDQSRQGSQERKCCVPFCFVFVQLRNCQQLHDSSLVRCQRTKAPPAIS